MILHDLHFDQTAHNLSHSESLSKNPILQKPHQPSPPDAPSTASEEEEEVGPPALAPVASVVSDNLFEPQGSEEEEETGSETDYDEVADSEDEVIPLIVPVKPVIPAVGLELMAVSLVVEPEESESEYESESEDEMIPPVIPVKPVVAEKPIVAAKPVIPAKTALEDSESEDGLVPHVISPNPLVSLEPVSVEESSEYDTESEEEPADMRDSSSEEEEEEEREEGDETVNSMAYETLSCWT